jgi:hypothetical protein
MRDVAVIEFGMSQQEFWELTPADYDGLSRACARREERLDRRAALIACYIANFAGRMRKEGAAPLTINDILGVPESPKEEFESFRERTMNQEAKLIDKLRMTDPDAEFMLSREVINALAQGRGRWSSYGSREKLLEALGDDAMQPMAVVRAMNGANGRKN